MEEVIIGVVGNLGVGGVLGGIFYLFLIKTVPAKEQSALEERQAIIIAFREESAAQRTLFREEQMSARQQQKETMDRLIDAIITSRTP